VISALAPWVSSELIPLGSLDSVPTCIYLLFEEIVNEGRKHRAGHSGFGGVRKILQRAAPWPGAAASASPTHTPALLAGGGHAWSRAKDVNPAKQLSR